MLERGYDVAVTDERDVKQLKVGPVTVGVYKRDKPLLADDMAALQEAADKARQELSANLERLMARRFAPAILCVVVAVLVVSVISGMIAELY